MVFMVKNKKIIANLSAFLSFKNDTKEISESLSFCVVGKTLNDQWMNPTNCLCREKKFIL